MKPFSMLSALLLAGCATYGGTKYEKGIAAPLNWTTADGANHVVTGELLKAYDISAWDGRVSGRHFAVSIKVDGIPAILGPLDDQFHGVINGNALNDRITASCTSRATDEPGRFWVWCDLIYDGRNIGRLKF